MCSISSAGSRAPSDGSDFCSRTAAESVGFVANLQFEWFQRALKSLSARQQTIHGQRQRFPSCGTASVFVFLQLQLRTTITCCVTLIDVK